MYIKYNLGNPGEAFRISVLQFLVSEGSNGSSNVLSLGEMPNFSANIVMGII
jgi:hypothetical protein